MIRPIPFFGTMKKESIQLSFHLPGFCEFSNIYCVQFRQLLFIELNAYICVAEINMCYS